MSKEIFDVEKAENLCKVYHTKRHYAKERVLKELIRCQVFFGNTSIVDCKLSLSNHYQKRTVQSVLNEFGYSLVHIKTHHDEYNFLYDDSKPHSEIRFV